MVFASCSERDGEPAVHERDSVVLSVGIASPGTRTWLDSSSDASVLPVYWSDGDCISVNGMQSSPLKVEAGEKLSQAQFELLNVEAPYSVLYPASAFSSAAADGTLRIQLPSSQEWVEGSFAPGAAVLCGRGESDAAPVSLYNLCGAVRVRLSDTEGAIITGLRLESIGDAQICGAYDLDMDNRELVPAGGGTVIGMTLPEGGTALSPTGTDFYFTLPAGNYPDGFLIRFEDAERHVLRSLWLRDSEGAEAGVTVSAGRLVTFSSLPYDPDGKEICSAADWE
ncbi:MAG: hypothetical protein IJ721_02960, partial [Bacteroidales bacterium]|nr:hypothetical protein [Bacteroidales bacterium]